MTEPDREWLINSNETAKVGVNGPSAQEHLTSLPIYRAQEGTGCARQPRNGAHGAPEKSVETLRELFREERLSDFFDHLRPAAED